LIVPSIAVPDGPPADPAWLPAWRRLDDAARAAVDRLLDTDASPGGHDADTGGLSELRAARDLVAAVPSGALLFVGASLPLRHLDLVMAPRHDVRLMTNRGLSGIDGTVSALVGAALSEQRRAVEAGEVPVPTYGLIGDLTLLHDQNGLLFSRGGPRPDVTLVVLNND